MGQPSRREFLHGAAAAIGLAATACARRQVAPWRGGEGAGSRLITRLREPYCAETRADALAASWLTPVDDFFVMSHGEVPRIDAGRYRLEVTGDVATPVRLTLGDLLAMRAVTVPATLMCAGNRRHEHNARRPVDDELVWGPGAVGNARWTGVPLAEVLALAGPGPRARHLWFEGLDRTALAGSFAGSIPIERVTATGTPPVLLAHAMNGRELTPLHGHPLRVVVPGYIGARSVKWLDRIVVSRVPSPSLHFRDAYHLGTGAARRPIHDLPVNAAICAPAAGMRLAAGRTQVVGYAIPGGAPATIDRVEVSTDGGRSWQRARLGADSAPGCWRLWSADVAAAPGRLRVVARAIDSTGRVQPAACPWNRDGYLYDGWPAIELDVGPWRTPRTT